MTDSERDRRQLDGLMASYTEMMVDLAEHRERLKGHDREIVADREQVEKAITSVMGGLEKIDVHCAERVQGVRDEVLALRKEIKEAGERAEARKERLQLTWLQKAGLAVAAASSMVAAVGMVMPK